MEVGTRRDPRSSWVGVVLEGLSAVTRGVVVEEVEMVEVLRSVLGLETSIIRRTERKEWDYRTTFRGVTPPFVQFRSPRHHLSLFGFLYTFW